MEVATTAQIVRSRGRISQTMSKEEADVVGRHFRLFCSRDNPMHVPPDWLCDAAQKDLPEIRQAVRDGFEWQRIRVAKSWRPHESVPTAHEPGCRLEMQRHVVAPPFDNAPGVVLAHTSMTAPAMTGRPPTAMIRLGPCETHRKIVWGV